MLFSFILSKGKTFIAIIIYLFMTGFNLMPITRRYSARSPMQRQRIISTPAVHTVATPSATTIASTAFNANSSQPAAVTVAINPVAFLGATSAANNTKEVVLESECISRPKVISKACINTTKGSGEASLFKNITKVLFSVLPAAIVACGGAAVQRMCKDKTSGDFNPTCLIPLLGSLLASAVAEGLLCDSALDVIVQNIFPRLALAGSVGFAGGALASNYKDVPDKLKKMWRFLTDPKARTEVLTKTADDAMDAIASGSGEKLLPGADKLVNALGAKIIERVTTQGLKKEVSPIIKDMANELKTKSYNPLKRAAYWIARKCLAAGGKALAKKQK